MGFIYEELGVSPVINAAGTYTALGGSRMSRQTLAAMAEAAGDFVPMRELQARVHAAIAELTRNESAYVCTGAAAGLYLAVAAAVQRLRGKRFFDISRDEAGACNVVMFRAHRNPYDLVIGHLGVQYRELAFPNIILPPTQDDLERAIDEHTAAVCYVTTGWAPPGYLPLEATIKVAKRRGVPVIVDAAANLPPVENLWRFTQMGADAVLFSGGKDLGGPQASGLMVGSKAFVDAVTSIGFPNYGIGRMLKVGREEMVGLYAAVKQYIDMDHPARERWCEAQIEALARGLAAHRHLRVERRFPNEAGQPIARAFVMLADTDRTPEDLRRHLLENSPPIHAYSEDKHGVFINPMSLREGETDVIIRRMLEF
ncbi:MAG: aminotransferase class V-fold PLP-dependent enzyme [Defluviitaleaceae bacterium]|nr:aminotransferase class V-fold PLP-dependent enzyme [Defluviitaleaceae bacterium]